MVPEVGIVVNQQLRGANTLVWPTRAPHEHSGGSGVRSAWRSACRAHRRGLYCDPMWAHHGRGSGSPLDGEGSRYLTCGDWDEVPYFRNRRHPRPEWGDPM